MRSRPEGQAAVRRGAVLKRVEQVRELPLGLLVGYAQHAEDAILRIQRWLRIEPLPNSRR